MRGFDLFCRCGAVHVHVDVPRRNTGTRVVCHCRDCQTAANVLEAADRLVAGAGTDIWQTTPDHVTVLSGAEHLRILRLSPKGLLRWYAGCCKTPMLNTLPNMRLPFVGLVLGPQDETREAVTGPVFGHAFTASAPLGSGAPTQDKNFARTGAAVVRRMIAAYLSGRARKNAFCDMADIPVEVLSLNARRAAAPKR